MFPSWFVEGFSRENLLGILTRRSIHLRAPKLSQRPSPLSNSKGESERGGGSTKIGVFNPGTVLQAVNL